MKIIVGWPAVAAGMVLGGIKGGSGKPLTGPALRRIWSRVCRDVAAEEPWRADAVRTASQRGTPARRPHRREPGCAPNADQSPPTVTALEPSRAFCAHLRPDLSPSPSRVPVPGCPLPAVSRSAMHSRPNAASIGRDPEEIP